MPEFLAQFLPDPVPPSSEEGPPALPPTIAPEAWEEFAVFRETFLFYLTPQRYASAVRGVGEMLYALVLDAYGRWPAWPESTTRTELRAALADVRHLEGFLRSVGREHVVSSLAPEDALLSQRATQLASQLETIAAELTAALGLEA